MDIDKLKFFRKLVVIALFADDDLFDRFVLKGGSAIDLIYQISSRASVDIDVSMENDFTSDEFNCIKQKLQNSIQDIFAEHNYTIFDFKMFEKPKTLNPQLVNFWGGYSVEFKIYPSKSASIITQNLQQARRTAETIGNSQSKKLTIDISKFEYCKGKTEKELDGYSINVYTPTMLIFEKLRAICQQLPEYELNNGRFKKSRPRDFYDIWVIMQHFDLELNANDIDTLKEIFAIKKVNMKLLNTIPKYYDFFTQDLASLKDTLTPIHQEKLNFKTCFDFVISLIKKFNLAI